MAAFEKARFDLASARLWLRSRAPRRTARTKALHTRHAAPAIALVRRRSTAAMRYAAPSARTLASSTSWRASLAARTAASARVAHRRHAAPAIR